jgi:hypothetical protein
MTTFSVFADREGTVPLSRPCFRSTRRDSGGAHTTLEEGAMTLVERDEPVARACLPLPPLEPDDIAVLATWESGEAIPGWHERECRTLLQLVERFMEERPRWHWSEVRQVAEGAALALARGRPVWQVEAALRALARRAEVIAPGSVDAFVAQESRPPAGVARKRRR